MTQNPPGWPAGVPGPGEPGWDQAAAQWLLDLCPPDFRSYPVLRRHLLGLAWLAWQHVASGRQALASGRGRVRVELGRDLAPGALQELIDTIELEQARLMDATRGIDLIVRALRAQRA